MMKTKLPVRRNLSSNFDKISSNKKFELVSKSGLKVRNIAGFSLIELLVAITIGGIILTVVMTSYAAMSQTNLQLDAARQLQKETNFAVIRMADRIRNFSVDLDNSTDKKLIIGHKKGVFEYLPNKKQLTMDEQPVFSSNILVTKMEFKYSKNSAKLQPWVQIYLKVASKKNKEITNRIRTTISSRIFE